MCSTREVGYQNKEIVDRDNGGYTWAICTLPSVGVDAAALTLGSWKITPPEGGLESTTSVEVNTFGADGQISGDYVYLDEVTSADFGVDPGWYTAVSIEEWEPVSADAQIIPYGEGVQIGSDCGATVTFAGEVVAEDRTFKINSRDEGGFTWTGNVTPVALKLSEFAITPPEGGLESTTSVEVNTFGADGQISGDYVYLDEVTSADFGVDPGWYTAVSIEEWEPVSAGDQVINAGEMFQIGSDCGAQITVPSAL